MNDQARPTRPHVIYLPIPPATLFRYYDALDAVERCPYYDEQWQQACREAAAVEIPLFEALGFTPNFDRNSTPRPTHDDEGIELPPGTALTVASTAIFMCGLREVPQHYVRIGAHVAAEGLCNTVYLYRLIDPEYRMWEQLETIEGVDREPVDRERRSCMGCPEEAEHKERFGEIVLELCRECYRPLVPARLLELGVRGESTFFGNEYLREHLGPRAPELRADLEDLVLRIRERAAARADSRLVEAVDRMSISATGGEHR